MYSGLHRRLQPLVILLLVILAISMVVMAENPLADPKNSGDDKSVPSNGVLGNSGDHHETQKTVGESEEVEEEEEEGMILTPFEGTIPEGMKHFSEHPLEEEEEETSSNGTSVNVDKRFSWGMCVKVHGHYCGPGWCDNQAWGCGTKKNVKNCNTNRGVVSESDACCRAHDRCCIANRNNCGKCDSNFVKCLKRASGNSIVRNSMIWFFEHRGNDCC